MSVPRNMEVLAEIIEEMVGAEVSFVLVTAEPSTGGNSTVGMLSNLDLLEGRSLLRQLVGQWDTMQ